VRPVLSRPYAGTYVGLLSLDAPWMPDDEWAQGEGTENDFFRPRHLKPDLGKIRGLFTATVSRFGAVSGQIQLENRIFSFTTVLDSRMSATFRISTTLRGVPWTMNGTLSFNPTVANSDQGFVDNVAHVVLRDVLLATPPLLQVGQTLYASAAGVLGAAESLGVDVAEGLLSPGTTTGAAAAAPAAPSAPVSSAQAAALPPGAMAASPDVRFLLSVNPSSATTVQSVTFSAVVTIIPTPTKPNEVTYRWYRNFTPLSDSNRITGAQRNYMLLRAPLLDSDFTDYYLEVTLPDGSKFRSGVVTLTKSSSGTGGVTGTTATPTALPMYFTGAVYRETKGETKETSFGQAAVLSAQVRFGSGNVLVRGYLGNGTRVTLSTYLGRSFITPEVKPPDGVSIDPDVAAATAFQPSAIPSLTPAEKQQGKFKPMLAGRAREAIDEVFLRRSTSQSFPLWFRGDTATEPVFGAMIFNGPRVYGALGALGLNTTSKRSEYTANLLAGYYYDPLSPYVVNLPTGQVATDQTQASLTTPDAYPGGLKVTFTPPTATPPTNEVQAAVETETGLLFGGLLESTSRYVRTTPAYSPAFAASRSLLACTTAGVIIQKADILPGVSWNSNPLGGYVGFLYRGKNGAIEPLRNVLGSGAPEEAVLSGRTTSRIEALRIDFTDKY
jgi:hypothetical protein